MKVILDRIQECGLFLNVYLNVEKKITEFLITLFNRNIVNTTKNTQPMGEKEQLKDNNKYA